MSIMTIGIDLAKNIFAIHGVDQNGKAVLIKPKVSHDQLLSLIVQLPPCLIGMEACSGAHHGARLFREYGHIVKLMAPKFVTPYRLSGKRSKNDAADAAAICEAVGRPNMRFVPVKEEHQQKPTRTDHQSGRQLPAQSAGHGCPCHSVRATEAEHAEPMNTGVAARCRLRKPKRETRNSMNTVRANEGVEKVFS